MRIFNLFSPDELRALILKIIFKPLSSVIVVTGIILVSTTWWQEILIQYLNQKHNLNFHLSDNSAYGIGLVVIGVLLKAYEVYVEARKFANNKELPKYPKIEQLTTNKKIFPHPDIASFIAFSSYEQDLMTSLYDNFTSKDSYMALLVGSPSAGKSIFSYKLGMRLKEHSNQNNVYYIDIAKAPIDIDRHIELLNNKNSYFVIDNVHLNVELSYKVFIHFEQKKSKILFVGRDIDKKYFEIEDIGEDIYAIFENKNELYRLKSFNKNDEKDSILEKTKAIMNAFKQLNNIQAEIGDDDAVADMINDNFVLLYYYLASWKEKPMVLFTSLTKEQLLSRVWNKITNEALKDKTDIEKLLSVAVLYQYEICAHKANSKVLSQRGLTHVQSAGYNYEEPCSLYHSNYAKLVIDAYCETLEFQRSRQTKEDLNIKYLKKHFEDNYSVISLSDELVKLRNNYEHQLLSRLLNEIDKQKVEECFVAPNAKTTLTDFTKVINILMNFAQGDLADNILQSLIEKQFDKYDLTITGLLYLLVFVGKKNSHKEETLKSLTKFFWEKYINIPIGATNLANIGNLVKNNRDLAKEIYQKLDDNDLVDIAKKSQAIDVLGSGLITLDSIDKTKTAKIYQKLDDNDLVDIAKKSQAIDVLGSGLITLDSIDKTKTTEIYKSLDAASLIEKLEQDKKLNLFNFNLLSIILIRREKNDEIARLKNIYTTFKDKKFFCTGCNNLKAIAHMTKNLKEIGIDVLADLEYKLRSFMATSSKNEKFRGDIPYFFAGIYNLYGKDYVEKAINKFILQNNYIVKDDAKPLLCDTYIKVAFCAYLGLNTEWICLMEKAYKYASGNEKYAKIHFFFAKNYLAFNGGKYSEDDFKKAQGNYLKSLKLGNEAQKIEFQNELEMYFQ